MYRVVLVDDEKRIVDGLSKVVKWDRFGCQVVGTAFDAVSGAEVIRQQAPQILFTDIRMPGDNGLAMLAGLRSEFPDMKVIVLTGYREFSYAQEAIRLGVFRFLTKPSKMAEINEAMESAVAALDMEFRKNGNHPKAAELEIHEKTEGLASQSDIELRKNGNDQNTREAEEGAGNAGSFVVRQAMEYMQDHYQEKLTLQGLAEHCYVSQWHLSKLLNRFSGKSFYDLLNEIRISKAKELLADPKLKIGDISEMVGYADTAHFSKLFKKYEGISANDYRNTL